MTSASLRTVGPGRKRSSGQLPPGAETDLSTLQEWLVTAMRSRSALGAQPNIAQLASIHLTSNDRFSAVEQLDVYRIQFWLRHTASLLEDFPGLSGILGQEAWERLVEGYLTHVAPTGWSLEELGRGLPDFIRTSADWLSHQRLCVDMARVEVAYGELFIVENPPALDAAQLSRIPECVARSALDTKSHASATANRISGRAAAREAEDGDNRP